MAKKKDDPKKPLAAKASSAPVYKKPETKLQDSLVKLVNKSESARKAYINGTISGKDSVSADGKKYATKDLKNAMGDSRTYVQVPRPATKGYQVNESEAKRGFKSIPAKAAVLPKLSSDSIPKKPVLAMNKKKK